MYENGLMTSLLNSLQAGEFIEAQGCCGSFYYKKGSLIFDNDQ